MAITRRQFLQRSGLAAGGMVVAPSLFGNPFVRDALADSIGDRYMIVLYLDGGNDGLNTVVVGDDTAGQRTFYQDHRKTGSGGIQLAPGELLTSSGSPMIDPATGTELGLHPGLQGFFDLYEDGKLAVVQGCGYPDFSLSHDSSTRIWEAANPTGQSVVGGWMGRHLAGCYGPTDIPAVAISDTLPPEFRQFTTSVLTIPKLSNFGFPYDNDWDPSDEEAKKAAFEAVHDAAAANGQGKTLFLGNSGNATVTASESYPPLHDDWLGNRQDADDWNDAYRAIGSTGREFREVSKIIYGVENSAMNVGARFFRVRNGGYDTHANQGGAETDGRQYGLHKEVGDAVKLFYDDMADLGIANKICIVVWSEFSRRIRQNENGTDHGSQGPMFVCGGTVNSGIYGNHMNLDPDALDGNGNTPYSQDGGNAFRSTDFRDVYGTVLKHWLNMDEATILSDVLPLDGGAAADYWTVPNFNLGFLP